MLRTALLFSTALCLAITVADVNAEPLLKLSDAQLKTIRAGVKERLKDPDSAKFGTIKAVKWTEG